MVPPRWLARANRRFTNRILGALPPRLSPFAVVHHVGRRSQQTYTALLAPFATPNGYLFAPTYGPDADWVRNVMAAGRLTMERRGEVVEVGNLQLIPRNEAWPLLPWFVKLAMRVLNVRWYLIGDRVTSG